MKLVKKAEAKPKQIKVNVGGGKVNVASEQTIESKVPTKAA